MLNCLTVLSLVSRSHPVVHRLQVASDILGMWKDNTTCRPFTAPSKLALTSKIISSSWSLASMDKNRKYFQPCFDYPLPKPHKRASTLEAFTIPAPSQYSSSPDQEPSIITTSATSVSVHPTSYSRPTGRC